MGESIVKKALLIAYHFPPIRVSSGIQRTLSMARYLRENGWAPVVLTISPRAYEVTSDDQLKDIPEGVVVKSAFGLDTARHLSIAGRYPGLLALPDRWVSWTPSAVISGLNLVRKEKPDLIWSTYPIATAHLVGLTLSRITELPWVADFRDSMTEENYPADRKRWKIYRWIERKTVARAAKIVFTAPGALRMYRDRYPDCDNSKFEVIPNGYDEEIFQSAEQKLQSNNLEGQSHPLKLLHSGVLYPSERDPTQFFDALEELKVHGDLDANNIKIVLRATGHDALYQPMLKERNIEDIVSLEPGVTYEVALSEMMNVDGLLLFQASNCNHQIPAKLYEYFRTGKPILALTDEKGDTAQTIKNAGVKTIVPIDNKEVIKEMIMQFINDPVFRQAACVSRENANLFSRQSLVKAYSEVLNSVASLPKYST